MKTIVLGKLRFSFSLSLFVFFILYLLFTIADLKTSAQTGNSFANRYIAHFSLVLLVSYLAIYVVYNIKKIQIKFQSILLPLILLFLWILIQNIFYQNFSWLFLVNLNMSVLWILSYLFFYLQTKKSPSKIYRLSWILFLFYIVETLYYFFYASTALNRTPILNVSYCCLALLPWISIKRNYSRYLAYLIVLFPIFLSMKRGAIIALPLMLLTEIVIRGIIDKKIIGKIIAIFLIVACSLCLFNIIDSVFEGFLSSRFTQEQLQDGSGRKYMYSLVISDIKDRNLFDFFIGKGAGSSISLLDTGVHNEWLEFLFSYGLIGLILYFYLFFCFFKSTFKCFKSNLRYAPSCYMMISLYFVLSMVSTGYGGYIGLLLFGFWGYIDGNVDNNVFKQG